MFEVTRKRIKETSDYILKVGYCNMQHLLCYQQRFAYSTRSEGWACDYFKINGVVISTGYAPIGQSFKNYELLKDYEQKAEKIHYDRYLSYEEKKEQIDKLLYELTELFKNQ